jgi:hypothetical protein
VLIQEASAALQLTTSAFLKSIIQSHNSIWNVKCRLFTNIADEKMTAEILESINHQPA